MLRRVSLLLALSLSVSYATAQPAAKPSAVPALKAAETAFNAGTAFLEKQKYPEALAQFQKVLKIDPDNADVLWNAGTAAFFANNYKLAATYFERDLKQEPQNGHLLAKLVQTYQALGDKPHRDARRAQVFAMHRSGKDVTDYLKTDYYCRDQFTVNGDSVLAMEWFELTPRVKDGKDALFGVRYMFYVTAPKAETFKMRLETGWNSLDSDGKGGFKPGTDMSRFYFDAYYKTGEYSRRTFDLLEKEPSYEVAKQHLIDILNGKATMISGRLRSDKGPGD